MSFKRSPSKVWWGNDSLEFREVSASPGSQDSGFSDIEPPQNPEKTKKGNSGETHIAKNIFKPWNTCENLNLTVNYREKLTPVKENFDQRLTKTEKKGHSPQIAKKAVGLANSEPTKRQRYVKHSPKVSRNLFIDSVEECKDGRSPPHQYSNHQTTQESVEHSHSRQELKHQHNNSGLTGDVKKISPVKSKTLKNSTSSENTERFEADLSSSSVEQSGEDESCEVATNFNSSSDCDSELEGLFDDLSEGYTSTPKVTTDMRHRRGYRKVHRLLTLDSREDARVPPIHPDHISSDNNAVQLWLDEAKFSTELECAITLQCKSIAAEVNQKISHMAACTTTIIRGVLVHSKCIENEYEKLESEKKHINPLAQSIAGNILDFLKTHTVRVNPEILKLYDQIRTTSASDQLLKSVSDMFRLWHTSKNQILVKEIKSLVDKLESPTSELDLKATLTGITSVALRNPELVEFFIKADIVPVLLIICEKCEGSSMRTLILRALSTMCSNSSAIRHFEKFSGIQIIVDTVEEDSRPEPERSEAIGLLAQITAPWLEENHSVKGFQDYSKKLIRALTKFASSTKCCQNLLLCAAALANVSSLDTKCCSHLIQYKSGPVLLEAVKNRGPYVSIYLLEQVATLLANMAAVEGARKQLVEAEAPSALLHFLRSPPSHITQNEDVERRLQQKSVIALSRLCSNKEAADDVVNSSGVNKLVELCRERSQRYNSDAVLVASLATLRKIVESCGTEVLSAQDSQELVEPKLLDSFLAYSAQNESYV